LETRQTVRRVLGWLSAARSEWQELFWIPDLDDWQTHCRPSFVYFAQALSIKRHTIHD